MANNLYYTESGKTGVLGPILIIISTLVVSLFSAFGYGKISFYIPSFFANILLIVVLGYLIGFTIGGIAYLTKIRNQRFVLLFSVLFAFFADFIAWDVWLSEGYRSGNVFTEMSEISKTGRWQVFKWKPKGVFLYLFWLGELALLVSFTIIGTKKLLSAKPFCEECNKWTKKIKIANNLEPIQNIAEFKGAMEQKHFFELVKLEDLGSVLANHTELYLSHCPKCNNNYYISISNVNININSKKKIEEDETVILENLSITKQVAKEISDFTKKINNKG